jgi:hypothetical protein
MARTAPRIPLSSIELAVSAKLGPGRVTGNAQPAVFSRQVAMYLAKCVGGWSTTQIGKFYNGRDHSTVCYAIQRIEALRELDPDVDCVLTALTEEIRALRLGRAEHKIRLTPTPRVQDTSALISEELLDALAERIVDRVFSRLTAGVVRQVPSSLVRL